jgi:hypothetical protein
VRHVRGERGERGERALAERLVQLSDGNACYLEEVPESRRTRARAWVGPIGPN